MSEIDFNQFEKEGTVSDIPESLNLQCGSYEVNERLEQLGISHNPDSIVLSDSFHCIFGGYNEGDYEIWLCHKSVPYLNARAYKVDLDTVNEFALP